MSRIKFVEDANKKCFFCKVLSLHPFLNVSDIFVDVDVVNV